MLLHDLTLGAAHPADERAVITVDGTWSRAQLLAAVTSQAHHISLVTRPGDRVAIVADSRPEVVALLLSIPSTGRVAVPINTRLRPQEIADQLRAVAPTMLVSTVSEGGRLDPVLDQVPSLRATATIGEVTGGLVVGNRGPQPSRADFEARARGLRPADADPAWIIFTSGTTGRAQGVVLSAATLGAAVATTAEARPLATDDVYLYPFPLYHVSAYNVLHALHRGRPVVLPRRFDVDEIVDLARRHQVTVMSLAPTMLRMLLDARAELSTLRTVAYGAAPMPPALLAEAAESLAVGFAQGYGMTELSGNAVFLSPEDHRAALAGDDRLLRAAGRPGPGVELNITDDGGRAVPPGQPGEVRVRAAQVCQGYWNDPDATAAAIVDGWLRTGDIGVLDGDGLLSIVDRAKDIIVTGGENVASREVEDVVARHPAVARVAVVGVPDERWGEAVWAAVVLRDGTERDPSALEAEIAALASGSLAGFKVPKRIVVVEDLPVNAGGKVVKAEVRRALSGDGEDEHGERAGGTMGW